MIKVSSRPIESGIEPGKYCEITVEDNGIGFNQKYAESVFGVFQRLHARHKYEGTGIGLAICRKIVEHHRGRITARSIEGHGTTISFTLRLAPQRSRHVEQGTVVASSTTEVLAARGQW